MALPLTSAAEKVGLSMASNVISFMKYVNSQLLQEEGEFNMKLRRCVGVKPPSAWTMQLTSVHACDWGVGMLVFY